MTFQKLRLSPLFVFLLFCSLAYAQQPPASRARITTPINENQRIVLRGNKPPLARSENDQGPAPDDLPTKRMMLLLSRSAEQESALKEFLRQQQAPGSPNFHKWLTPAEFGERFGVDDADIKSVTDWLKQQGFAVSQFCWRQCAHTVATNS